MNAAMGSLFTTLTLVLLVAALVGGPRVTVAAILGLAVCTALMLYWDSILALFALFVLWLLRLIGAIVLLCMIFRGLRWLLRRI